MQTKECNDCTQVDELYENERIKVDMLETAEGMKKRGLADSTD